MGTRSSRLFSAVCVILAIICAISIATVTASINQHVSDATTQFSWDLLKTVLHDETGNVVLSPVSVYTLLAMLQQGARSNSRTELNNVLHALPDETKEGYHNLTRHYQQPIRHTTVEFASRAFARSEGSIIPEFKESLVSDFLSDIEQVNFSDSAAASEHINSWVAQSTHNRITELFGPDDIPEETFLILANAVYFMSRWQTPLYVVGNRTFSPRPNEEKHVPSTYNERFYEGGIDTELGAKWIHMNFAEDHHFTVLLVLPTERHGLDNLVNCLTAANLTALFSHSPVKFVKLTLPKFTLNTDTKLIPLLKKLGLNDVFQDTADLSGITAHQTKVSKIVQKAEVALDEIGITAAAATGLIQVSYSLEIYPNAEELIFTADEPFLFFIVDRENSMPLFAGRVSDPSSN